MIVRIRLTPAQKSALECSGLYAIPFSDLDANEQVLRRAIQPGLLVLQVSGEEQETIASTLNDLSNAEDHWARYLKTDGGAKFARRAAASLAALMLKVNRLKFGSDQGGRGI